MKMIASVFWIAVLMWTWCLASTDRPISIKTYREVNKVLETELANWLTEAGQPMTDISFEIDHAHIVEPNSLVEAEVKFAGISSKTNEVQESVVHIEITSTDQGKSWAVTEHKFGHDEH